MSFMLTTQQIRDGTKTVTRRRGWAFLKVGERVMACVKCMGLGPDGKVEHIREIEIVSVRREKLDDIILANRLGSSECAAEGFPTLTGGEFVEMFCRHMRTAPYDEITRIEFKYV